MYLGRQDNLLWIANANTGRVSAGAGYFLYDSTDCSGKPRLYMGDSSDKHPQMLYTYLGCEEQDQTTQLYRMVGETHSLAARSYRGGDAGSPCGARHAALALRGFLCLIFRGEQPFCLVQPGDLPIDYCQRRR